MAGPITWRNVAGPSVADAARPFQLAQNSFNNAFDMLGKQIQQVEATDAKNWDAQKGNNTQAFLDEMHKYRTPEQLEAARQAGVFDQLQAGFGAQVDRSQVRGALDNRLATLRQQNAEALKYADEQLTREQAPIKDRILSLAVQGNRQGALDELAKNPNLRNAAEIHKAVIEGDRSRIKWDQDQKRFTWDTQEAAHKEALRPGALRLQNESILNQQSQRATAAQQRAESAQRMDWGQEDRNAAKESARLQALAANNAFGEGSLESTRNIGTMAEFIKNNVTDADERDYLNESVARLSKERFKLPGGQDVGYPVALLKAAIMEARDNNWWFTTNRAENFERLIKERMQDPQIIQQGAAMHQSAANVLQNPLPKPTGRR